MQFNTSVFKMQQHGEEVESWDNDQDFQVDELNFREGPFTINSPNTAVQPTRQRDSLSSHISFVSELGSSIAANDERQFYIEEDNDKATIDAITSAIQAGIPIPSNVPSSALIGGEIKRLGGKNSKKVVGVDWTEDLDLSGLGAGGLRLTRHEEHDDFDPFFDDPLDVPTIKAAKQYPSSKTVKDSMISSLPKSEILDDFEGDFILTDDSTQLHLPLRGVNTKNSDELTRDELDEWADGSLGIRYGEAQKMQRSSSISLQSPSATSSMTLASDQEDLDGIILPEGPLDVRKVLMRRHETAPDAHIASPAQAVIPSTTGKDDFFNDIDIGNGEIFDSGKLTLNRNIKHTVTQQISPSRRPAITLSFKNKMPHGISKIPRPQGGHERTPSTLEPVSEGDGPLTKRERSHSRPRRHSPSRHSPHTSLSSIPAATMIPKPVTPPARPVKTSTRPAGPKTLGTRPSMKELRSELASTNSQLLKVKRSMPAIRSGRYSPSKPASYQRPVSRSDRKSGSTKPAPTHQQSAGTDRLNTKTPAGRPRTNSQPRADSRSRSGSQSRKNSVPFLGGGCSQEQSQHVLSKTSRQLRRQGSNASSTSDAAAYARNATKRTLNRAQKPRTFGDGSELEIFDDLPTSEYVESKFVKKPVGRGAPRSVKSRLGHSERAKTPTAPVTRQPPAHPRQPRMNYGFTPRFARDTEASRRAREERTGLAAVSTAPGTSWKTRGTGSPQLRKKKAQEKPFLIKPLTKAQDNKSLNGMVYNAKTFSWVGNQEETTAFEQDQVPTRSPRAYEASKGETPRPALIVNANATPVVQIVGDMVFDPQRMCWIRLKEGENHDEVDPFAGLPDLDDGRKSNPKTGRGSSPYGSAAGGFGSGDWCVGEEFDVGPAFVRRQREEEERWARKIGAWMVRGQAADETWRWALRELAM